MANRWNRSKAGAKKDNGKNGGGGKKAPKPKQPARRWGNRRSTATAVLAPGTGASVPKAFGSNRGHDLRVWDAKHLHHLPLPRAVGPYTVIRATKRWSTTAQCVVMGTFQETAEASTASQRGHWASTIAVEAIDPTLAMNAASNAYERNLSLSQLGDMTTVVPSAYSVQLMNPNALQTTSGTVYAGVMNTQAKMSDITSTWNTVFTDFVQFQNPRLMTGPKLALRGVQMDSYALNMNKCSEFEQLRIRTDGNMTWTGAAGPDITGWAPMMVWNPNGIDLEYLVTVEFRVRFDLGNPAAASHSHHPVASDSTWDRLVKEAVSFGNGVKDIADVVANTGMAINAARGVARLIG